MREADMENVIVKMCGFMREEDVDAGIRQSVDILGFVVDYPVPVPWNMELARAEELIKHFRDAVKDSVSNGNSLSKDSVSCGNGSHETRCCVVTGGPVDKILNIDRVLRPDYIQLHYKETADDIKALKAAGITAKIVKTVPLKQEDRMTQSGRADIAECARAFEEAGADIVLVDARGPENASNSADLIDAELYRAVKQAVTIPVMAAGGITPENVRDIVDILQPDIIDMMTGIEISPGIKSEERIISLMRGVRHE
jgi:phosphoribosylanthranilate isomerase